MTDGNNSLNLFFSKNIFIGSFQFLEDIPHSNLPECCFVGRSNVGKSSIINSITKTKSLAKISKKPGSTKSINLFQINNLLNFVDLPGYGYAKISKMDRQHLLNLKKEYLMKRKNLKKIFLLIDSNIGIKNSDIDFLDSISLMDKNFSVILTKIDKISENLIQKQVISLISFMKNYKNNFKEIFISSSKKNKGIIDIQKNIFSLSKDNEI